MKTTASAKVAQNFKCKTTENVDTVDFSIHWVMPSALYEKSCSNYGKENDENEQTPGTRNKPVHEIQQSWAGSWQNSEDESDR